MTSTLRRQEFMTKLLKKQSIQWFKKCLQILIIVTSFYTRYSCLFRRSLPCVCDTRVQQCWSAGWRSAVMSPCRCESEQCEPLRSAQHPPPHTWNKNQACLVSFYKAGEKPAKMMTADFSPDLEDLPRLFFGVRGGGDDEQAIQQVDGDAMRALIVCATNTERWSTHMKYGMIYFTTFLIILNVSLRWKVQWKTKTEIPF